MSEAGFPAKVSDKSQAEFPIRERRARKRRKKDKKMRQLKEKKPTIEQKRNLSELEMREKNTDGGKHGQMQE